MGYICQATEHSQYSKNIPLSIPPRETQDNHSPAFCNCIHCAGPRTLYKWIQSIYSSVCHSFHYMFLRLLHITVYIYKSDPSLLFHNIPLYGPTTVCLT